MPNKNQHYGKKDFGKDEITFSVGKNCGKYVARHGVGLQ